MTPPLPPSRSARVRLPLALVVTALLGSTLVGGPVQAAVTGVDLRVLLVSNGDVSVEALATQMDREGVPYQRLAVSESGRATVTADFLVDDGTGRGRFQAVVLPNQAGGGLAAEELAALSSYERQYGVRRVNAYDFPSTSMGLQPPTYSGELDGGSATVTAAGRAHAFRYLRGPIPIDDVDPSALEVYGYVAQPATKLPAGETFTPLVTVTAGSAQGVLAGVHSRDGREELVLTAAYNPHMLWFNQLAHGIVTWMTRGIHLGHHRSYFAVQVDDVLVADSRWSVDADCTPGDDCVDPGVTTPDIRMTAADVTRLVTWQRTNDFRLDMVFNGSGEETYKAEAGATADPLTDAFVAAQAEFPWVNHTWSHPYLGCIQIAPTVSGESWRCATSATDTPRQDPDVPAQGSGGTFWASQAFIERQLRDNIEFARAKGFTDFDATEVVTGEHSGLRSTPNQPEDNPFFGAALDSVGVRWTASDASREPDPRGVSGATTVPRYPMNIYYNTGTYREQIDEYNWYYTSAADGGGGICEANPASTCIPPLPARTEAEAKASFDGYLKPLEVRHALSKVVTNDPRPFYAHQSNLTEDALLYPVVEGVLDSYSAVYDRAVMPLVRLDLRAQGQTLQRQGAWASAASGTTAYVDRSGVHVSGDGEVPLTVPAGTAVNGAALESYGGELSGWLTGPVTASLTTPAGGYLSIGRTAPAAPSIGTANPGRASATVAWGPPADTGGSAVTGYVVRAFAGTAEAPAVTVRAAADVTSAVVTGLTNGTAYTFDVAAVNRIGTSAWSARSNVVTPTELTTPTDPGTATTPTATGPADPGTATGPTDPGTATEPTDPTRTDPVLPFSDIAGDVHRDSIVRLARAEVTSGFFDGTFRPGQSMTRGQMASFLTRALRLRTGSSAQFSDVRGDTHESAIGALAAAGITTGLPDGTFRPDQPVTRGQLASFLSRALRLPPGDTTRFTDVSGDVHEAAIGAVASAGIATGFSDGTFRPRQSVSRGQMASFLARGLGL